MSVSVQLFRGFHLVPSAADCAAAIAGLNWHQMDTIADLILAGF